MTRSTSHGGLKSRSGHASGVERRIGHTPDIVRNSVRAGPSVIAYDRMQEPFAIDVFSSGACQTQKQGTMKTSSYSCGRQAKSRTQRLYKRTPPHVHRPRCRRAPRCRQNGQWGRDTTEAPGGDDHPRNHTSQHVGRSPCSPKAPLAQRETRRFRGDRRTAAWQAWR